MDVNNLNENVAFEVLVSGVTSFFELSSFYELSDVDSNILSNYLDMFFENEVTISYDSFVEMLKNNNCSFIFGTDNTSFVFRCEAVTSDNLKDGTFSCGGFHMAMPNKLTMIEVGKHVVIFGNADGISYRFYF